MWNWFNCYLSGRHEYAVWCEPGNIFLRCVHCGRRSTGWHMHEQQQAQAVTRPKTGVVGLTARAHGEHNTVRAGSPHF